MNDPSPINASSKVELRRALRARRRDLDAARQRIAARRLARRLALLGLFGPRRHVAFYLSNDGEIDPGEAMRLAAAAGTCCYLPVVPPKGARVLRFAPVHADSRFRPNRFGIPEPVVEPGALRHAAQLDTVLLPLVGFDAVGNRLGMGGGFYDATLAARAARRHFRRPRVLGLAHQCQQVPAIDAEPWDIPLDGIATDRSLLVFGGSSAATASQVVS